MTRETSTTRTRSNDWAAAAVEAVEAEGAQQRAEARAQRKTPEAKAKRNRGRAQRRRGYRAEKRIEERLSRFGWRRIPMSGALGGRLAGDLRRVKEDWTPYDDGRYLDVVECKHRAADWPGLRKWLEQGGAQLLILDAGAGKEPLVVMTLQTLERVLSEAGYDGGQSAG